MEKRMLKSLFGGGSSDDEDSSDDELGILNDVAGSVVCDNEHSITYLMPPNCTITLHTNKAKGIAHQLWPAAVDLCRYVELHQSEVFPVKDIAVLELGAGIGLCGIHASVLGCQHVVLTDLPAAMELLTKNIDSNMQLLPSSHTQVLSAQVLSWGSEIEMDAVTSSLPSRPLIILAADCVYWECLYQPFFVTLEYFIARGAIVYLSYVKRWKKDNKFFALCRKHFSVEVLVEESKLMRDDFSQTDKRQISRIYRMSKKSPLTTNNTEKHRRMNEE